MKTNEQLTQTIHEMYVTFFLHERDFTQKLSFNIPDLFMRFTFTVHILHKE